MAIEYIGADIFTSPAKVLVNPVNLDGVMGKGLALQFKIRYPQMFEEYKKLCVSENIRIGLLGLYKTPNKWIINFPTKHHWNTNSKLEDIEKGLENFVNVYEKWNIPSVAFPKLGCGLGGLDWIKQVNPLMVKYLEDLAIPVYIHF